MSAAPRNHRDSPQPEFDDGNDDLDHIITQGINSLSFDELQKEQEELHGVSGDKAEKQTSMNYMLATLQTHLQQIKGGTAYEDAEKLDQDYVRNRDFRINFLRATQYDPKEAAAQMIRHFDLKASLFSKDKLARDILLSDLDDDDMACLLRGSHQISPVKDRSNRKIFVQLPGIRDYKTIENEMRAMFYLSMELVKSVDYNSRGVIYIYYAVGNFRKHGADLMSNYTIGMAAPFYTAGLHLCFDNPTEAMITKGVIAILSAKMKAKIKVHYGSHSICLKQLNTYGIPEHSLPISDSKEEVTLDCHLAWYQDCLQKENVSKYASSTSMVTPNENDVMCVGRKVNNEGNDRLLVMAAGHADWYNNGNSRERRSLVDLIIEDIRKSGGRFLKPDEHSTNEWKEVSVDEARTKVGQLFRNIKKRARSSTATSARRTIEEPEDAHIVTTVSDEDVLFGRNYNHAGNERLRQQVEVMSAEYNTSSRGRKKEIADSLVQDVKSRGGRFLKPLEGDSRWVEVSDKMAETKVSERFRNHRKRKSEDDV